MSRHGCHDRTNATRFLGNHGRTAVCGLLLVVIASSQPVCAEDGLFAGSQRADSTSGHQVNSPLKTASREGEAPAEPRETSDLPTKNGSAGASPSHSRRAVKVDGVPARLAAPRGLTQRPSRPFGGLRLSPDAIFRTESVAIVLVSWNPPELPAWTRNPLARLRGSASDREANIDDDEEADASLDQDESDEGNGIEMLAAEEDEVPEGDAAGAEKSETSKPEDVSLDALLDLADKAPEQLQSIGVKDAPRGLGISPDAVFTPDDNQGNAANSIGGLLSQAPGVVSRSTSALNQDARIRGYSGSQVVGVADGMNQGKTRLDIDSLFSQIDPNLVESITVIAGPYSVEYGPGFAFFDAQLIRPGRTEELTYTSTSNVGFNTNGRQIMWRETAGYSDSNSGAIVSFGQRMGNDYRAGGHGPDYRVPASYHVADVFASVSNDVSDRSRIDAHFLHQTISNTELPGVAYDINTQNSDQLNLRWTWRDDVTGADRFQTQVWWNQAKFDADASRVSKQQTFVETLLGQPYPELAGGGTLIGNGLSESGKGGHC